VIDGDVRVENNSVVQPFDGAPQVNQDVSLNAPNRIVFTKRGRLSSQWGKVTVTSDTLKMLNGASLSADNNLVTITTVRDAVITGVSGGSLTGGIVNAAPVLAVSITAGGRIFGATDSRGYDVRSSGHGKVYLKSSIGIGDKTIANELADDADGSARGSANLVTDAANRVIIRSGIFETEVTAGNTFISTSGAIGEGKVIAYGLKAKSRNEMVGAKYQGFNLVRDIDRLQRIGDATSSYWIEPRPKTTVPAVVERPSPPQISNLVKPIDRSAPTVLRDTLPVNLDALFGVTLAPPRADDVERRRRRELQVEPQ
jgi:hypothetical protein